LSEKGYGSMQIDALTPGLIITIGVLLLISAMSIYVSRVFLPAKIKTAYVKSITALATAVETKESGTIGHAERVAELTMEIARRLGTSQRELERIHYAALLMDIGKANVPQSVLNKTGQLTAEEWHMVRSHPSLGAEMVSAVPFLADLQDYVLHHHEYYDGSGYPDGLKGSDIPLASRILAVAADYDAMSSERPYHSRVMGVEEAREEIRRGRGVKYDPTVVDAFMSMLDEAPASPAKAA
jgi:putative nucleotidyltransferase with HDIG domain